MVALAQYKQAVLEEAELEQGMDEGDQEEGVDWAEQHEGMDEGAGMWGEGLMDGDE